MSGFLYFLPGYRQSSVQADDLLPYGLSHIVDFDDQEKERLYFRQCRGPSGEGAIVGNSLNWTAEQVKASDEIEWRKFPKPHAEIQAYCGWMKKQPLPLPNELKRRQTVSGKLLALGDGRKWLIPNAKVVTQGGSVANLPVSFGLDEETGAWIANQVIPKYRSIWEHAEAYYQASIDAVLDTAKAIDRNDKGEEMISFTIPDGQQLVVDAVQANYRVSALELSILGALISGIAQPIAEILIDTDGWENLKKKEGDVTGAG